jgi:hypothetical protein
MANLWYLVQGDDDLGPMTTDELKRLAADRKIGPRDLVRKEGTSRWVLASAVEGLLSAPVGSPSAPPSPSTGSYRPVESPPPSDLNRATPQSAPEPLPVATAAPEGQRSPWMWVVAGSALLTLVIAIARIATWIAMQDGSQVQEFAIPQPFDARIARAQHRPARAGPVAKKAAPAVRAAAVNRNPAPVDAPAPKVATPPPSAPSSDYIRLGTSLSNIYRGDYGAPWVLGIDADPSNLTHFGLQKFFGSFIIGSASPVNGAPAIEQLTGAIPRLKGARDPVVKEAVARLEAGQQAALEYARSTDEGVDEARRSLEGATGRAAALTGSPIERPTESELNHARTELEVGSAYHKSVKANASGMKQIAWNGIMEAARLDCWKTIVAKLPEIYRESPPGNDMIRFRLTAPDPAVKEKRG